VPGDVLEVPGLIEGDAALTLQELRQALQNRGRCHVHHIKEDSITVLDNFHQGTLYKSKDFARSVLLTISCPFLIFPLTSFHLVTSF
jgi:hypothetical protein